MALALFVDTDADLIIDTCLSSTLNLAPQLSWFDPLYWQSHNAVVATAKGRGTTYFVNKDQHTLVLRQYLRGGLVRHISKDKFVFTGDNNTRPWQELSLLNSMNASGLPVPKGLAGYVSKRGPFYTAAILTLAIEGAVSLHQQLTQSGISIACWEMLGYQVRRFHDHQIYHHDLNVHNFLFDSEQDIWLIDFDKCESRSGNDWKPYNVKRFYRSLLKEQSTYSTYQFTQQDWLAFKRGYND